MGCFNRCVVFVFIVRFWLVDMLVEIVVFSVCIGVCVFVYGCVGVLVLVYGCLGLCG